MNLNRQPNTFEVPTCRQFVGPLEYHLVFVGCDVHAGVHLLCLCSCVEKRRFFILMEVCKVVISSRVDENFYLLGG